MGLSDKGQVLGIIGMNFGEVMMVFEIIQNDETRSVQLLPNPMGFYQLEDGGSVLFLEYNMEIFVFIGVSLVIAILSGYKSHIGRYFYLGGCGVTAVIGGSIMGFSREVFISAIYGAKEGNEQITEAFVEWGISAFDQFAMIAMVIVFSTLLAVFIASRCDPDNRLPILREPSRVVLAMQCFLAIISVIYCVNLVNPLFYVAGYITRFTLGGMALLFVGYMFSDTARKGMK